MTMRPVLTVLIRRPVAPALMLALLICALAACGSPSSGGGGGRGVGKPSAMAKPTLPAAGTFTPSPIPYSLSAPMVLGPDGNLWIAEGNNVARVTPTGTLTEFSPTSTGAMHAIVLGPDGNLWIAASANGPGPVIYRVSPNGQFTTFGVPQVSPWGYSLDVDGIAVGPDSNLWFTEGPTIVEMSADGHVINQWTLPNPDNPDNAPLGPINVAHEIATGPDGNLWFSAGDSANAYLGRITPSGAIHLFQASAGVFAAGPDGNLWFTEATGSGQVEKIARMTPSGQITEFPMPVAGTGNVDIIAGPDGNLWFTEIHANAIGRITPAGVIDSYPVPDAYGGLFWPLAVGSDHNIWFQGVNGMGWVTA
jgi:virginiamycin B lyase